MVSLFVNHPSDPICFLFCIRLHVRPDVSSHYISSHFSFACCKIFLSSPGTAKRYKVQIYSLNEILCYFECLAGTPVYKTWQMQMYSAFTNKTESNCHFPAPSWSCTIHLQALQDIPDMNRVSLHRNNEINLTILEQFLPGAGK